MTGPLWAVVAGAGFGVFQAFNRRAVQGMDVYSSTFLQLFLSTLVLATVSVATQDLHLLRAAPPEALVHFGLAGFVHFFVGWTLLNASQKRIGAVRTSPLIGTTPFFGTAIAALALREFPTLAALLGIALTVGGVTLVSDGQAEGGDALADPDQAVALRAGWQGALPGLATALCWAISPIFIRYGLRGLPSPLVGVTVGLAASSAAYGLALAIRQKRSPARISLDAFTFKVGAAILVGLSTWARWVALDLSPVAVVLALASISVPTAIVLAPVVVGQHLEQVTRRLWVGAGLVVGGSVLLVFAR